MYKRQLIISANQELEARGEEPLYVVYPYDGLSLADSPLGYLDSGDNRKEAAFLALQAYLLSDEVQNAIQRTGRRTGYDGVSPENEDVFRTDWGVQPQRVLSPIRMPSADVLMECLDLYQTEFRKPSLTVYCLDYSGSMLGAGRDQMVEAMRQILIQEDVYKRQPIQCAAGPQHPLQLDHQHLRPISDRPADRKCRHRYLRSGQQGPQHPHDRCQYLHLRMADLRSG